MGREEEQAAAVEGTLAGDSQCDKCKGWFNNPLNLPVCNPCWSLMNKDARMQYWQRLLYADD
jgi:hypothetical protein